MTPLPEFVPFRKIPRWSRDIIITEKIDGTNGVIHVSDDLSTISAGSRSRWITSEADNYGFARWVYANEKSLIADLGPGYHFGEWWGQGIQRRYGMTEKRFSLFNVTRWLNATFQTPQLDVVPKLYEGPLIARIDVELDLDLAVEQTLDDLHTKGSVAAPGFMDPEGIVIFHTASGALFTKTIKGDDKPKTREET